MLALLLPTCIGLFDSIAPGPLPAVAAAAASAAAAAVWQARRTRWQAEQLEAADALRARLGSLLPLPRTFFRVKPAGGKGDGLFATNGIDAGTFLFDYEGERLSASEMESRYPGNPGGDYVISAGVGAGFIDAVTPDRRNLARYMNHDGKAPNCRCMCLPASLPKPPSVPATPFRPPALTMIGSPPTGP